MVSDCRKTPAFSMVYGSRGFLVYAKIDMVMGMLDKAGNRRNQIQMVDVDMLVPEEHLLRKVDRVINFDRIYGFVEQYYCPDNGRPAVDPVVLFKMVFIQHLFGIPSLRRTVEEINVNVAYRWFLGFDLTTKVPHFSTVSYAFATRFPSEVFEQVFSWILEEAVVHGCIDPSVVFIDATHVKANANRKKYTKEQAKRAARIYDEQLREEINQDRIANGKKPLKLKEQDEEITVTKSTTDPDSGMFHKGEHERAFAYTTHVACDRRGFVLDVTVTPGNVHDSVAFDPLYGRTVERFPEIETLVLDAAYKNVWICKKIIDDGRNPSMPYKRPGGKKGMFRPHEFVYDEYYNCVICPHNQVLPYRTTDRKGYRIFTSNPAICASCPDLARCTKSRNHQKTVTKHIWEDYIEQAEDFRHSPAGKESYSLRSETIERVFADAKEKHGMRYTFHRGLARVTNWVKLKFAAMNLKRLALWAFRGPFFHQIYTTFAA